VHDDGSCDLEYTDGSGDKEQRVPQRFIRATRAGPTQRGKRSLSVATVPIGSHR